MIPRTTKPLPLWEASKAGKETDMATEKVGTPYTIESIGPDVGAVAYDFEFGRLPPSADWFVEWYEAGSYDGSGSAVWKVGDVYYVANLGHCSCYGPYGDGGRCDADEHTADSLRRWLTHHDIGKPRTEEDYDWKEMGALAASILPRLPKPSSPS